jgi:hypothetical protein
MSVYSASSPNSPPWRSTDSTGGWIGEHDYPVAGIVYKPKGSGLPSWYGPDQDVVIICGEVGEDNDLVAWLDLDGNNIHGTPAEGWSGKSGWCAQECGPVKEVESGGERYVIDSVSNTVRVFQGNELVRKSAPSAARR